MLSVALAQFQIIPGRPDLNCQSMLDMIRHAKTAGADLIVFPEMAIPGYLLGDLWEQQAFLRDCEYWGSKIVAAADGIAIMFGNVGVDWDKHGDDGRVRKYNSFFTAVNSNLVQDPEFPYPFRIKTLHPNYREFDDTRYFFSLRQLAEELSLTTKALTHPIKLSIAGRKLVIGCILCEDGWSSDYGFKPIASLCADDNRPDLVINISSSPFTSGKNNKRHRVFASQVRETGVPLIYVNGVGIQNNGKTVYAFDGCSTVYDHDGGIAAQCPAFQPDLKIVRFRLPDCEPEREPNVQAIPDDFGIDMTYKTLHYAVKEFLRAAKIEKVVVGISGGIDSAVTAALYRQILPAEQLLLVNMPSVFNSTTTKDLAAQLANNLGSLYTVASIQQAVDLTIEQLEHIPIRNTRSGAEHHLKLSQLARENVQARDRSARVLAGLAASFGGVFTCNANKSEMTAGYCTLYGDEAGFLAALADLWKHQVYELAHYLNEQVYGREAIPFGTIDIIPSAELSRDQAVDEGKGDPLIYPYHDYLFRSFVEYWNRATPEDILEWYLSDTLEERLGCKNGLTRKLFQTPQDFVADLERWWNQYMGMGIAKRIQSPPIVAVSRRAFGFDHREAQNGPYYTAKYQALKNELLREKCPH